jgi:hypothetical protein
MANRKDLGNVKLMHPRSGIETDRWRDIRHSILKVRIKMPHMIERQHAMGSGNRVLPRIMYMPLNYGFMALTMTL